MEQPLPANPVILHESTGSTAGDALLVDLIQLFGREFPGRVAGCYIIGSYADATAVRTSDVDLTLVFADHWLPGEARRAGALLDQVAAGSALEVDGSLADEATLVGGADPALKLAARCVYGTDRRAAWPLVSLPVWTRDRMHSSYWRLVGLTGRPGPVQLPLAMPDAADEFYGYLRRTVRLPDGRTVRCTRDLIRLVGWAATARLAWETGIYVARKADCHHLYAVHIGDGWETLLAALYHECRGRWSYLIPDGPAERARLRDICTQVCRFENAFLVEYRRYLLAELGGDPEAQAAALAILAQVPLDDPQVKRAIVEIAAGPDSSLAKAAQATVTGGVPAPG